MLINIENKYNEIESDILSNIRDLFNRRWYFTHKYRGDRLNDINVGLFLNDSYEKTVQIFLRNKTGCIKSHIILNDNNTLKEIKLLHNEFQG